MSWLRQVHASLCVVMCFGACALVACNGESSRASGNASRATPEAQRHSTSTSPAATRVVSLAPSMTEALFAIGAGANVVGVSRYCDYPEAATRLPRVGGFLDPSLEAILALSPDLVVGARSPSNRGVVETIERHHIAVYFPHDESIEGVFDMLRELGKRTGHEGDANAFVARMNAHLHAIDAALAQQERPSVLLVFNQNPLSVAGRGTFPAEMLQHAGGTNVITDTSYPTLSIERVMALAPEVIIEAWMGAGERRESSFMRYATIPAVAHHRVIPVEDERLLRPGPRLVEGVAVLAHLLHPEVTIPSQ